MRFFTFYLVYLEPRQQNYFVADLALTATLEVEADMTEFAFPLLMSHIICGDKSEDKKINQSINK